LNLNEGMGEVENDCRKGGREEWKRLGAEGRSSYGCKNMSVL